MKARLFGLLVSLTMFALAAWCAPWPISKPPITETFAVARVNGTEYIVRWVWVPRTNTTQTAIPSAITVWKVSQVANTFKAPLYVDATEAVKLAIYAGDMETNAEKTNQATRISGNNK